MTAQNFQLAQVNIARMLGPLDGPIMAGFVARLDEINALADGSPGFVWRFQTTEGNATALRPYDDERILFNMSVWETLDDLRQYVYRGAHSQLISQRKDWFSKFEMAFMALWWVPAGHIPTVEEAKARLALLQAHGETAEAFSFKKTFPVPVAAANTEWLSQNGAEARAADLPNAAQSAGRGK